jgi:hypothetical protein
VRTWTRWEADYGVTGDWVYTIDNGRPMGQEAFDTAMRDYGVKHVEWEPDSDAPWSSENSIGYATFEGEEDEDED